MNSNPPRREATFLETDEDIRAALAARQAAARGAPLVPPAPPPQPVSDMPVAAPPPLPRQARPTQDSAEAARQVEQHEPEPFRPTIRPPIAIMLVLDDNGDGGVSHRLFNDKTVIGRTEGDILVPHDGMISTKHAEIIRQQNWGSWRWILNDLGSTNGTYVRVSHGVLRHEQEFLIGRTRFRFDAPRGLDTVPLQSGKSEGTIAWQDSGAAGLIPSVVELTAKGEASRIPITAGEIWIGRGDDCQVVPKGDPFVSARHARIHRDARGRWLIENNRSPNGIWLRVEQMPLEASCMFMLGEQRFKMQVVPS